ncbi:hypothetical protein Bca52824_077549 [Brassica carinata]|nr:hypothetical protein Bca52824_077549 [Brassica carinata]
MGSSASKTSSSSSSSTSVSSSPSPAIHKAFSFPTPLVHHPPARKGDTHHLVSLTSTSYGSLLLKSSSSDQETPPRISVSDKNAADPVSRDSFS